MSREMRETNLSWLGPIPKEWQLRSVKNFYPHITTGFTPPSKQDELYDPDGDIWVNISDLNGTVISDSKKHINHNYAISKHKNELIPKGSLMYAFKLSVGQVAFASCDLYTNEAIASFHPDKGIYLDFLKYSSSLIINNAEKNIYGADLLNQERIKNAMIVYPPISEQHKIVSFLDRKCAAIDMAITKTKESIEKIEEYKQSVITKVVTNGLISGTELQDSEMEWLGKIPKNWEARRIGSIFSETNERGNDDLPILTVSINTGISDKEVDEEERTRKVLRSEDKSKYKRMEPGDIVYNMMRAWQGAFGAARIEGMVSPAYVTARPIIEVDSRYFEYLFRTDRAAEEFKRHSRGITDFRLRLYWPEFKTIKVCVPPLEEQREIADYLDNLYKSVEEAQQKHQMVIEKLEEYRKSIIYHAVTGKIDCREVSE